jgi:thioredoxin-related protein
MSDSILKKTELLANIAIIVVAILLGGVLVTRYLLTSDQAFDDRNSVSRIAAGTKVSLPEIDWAKNNQTLLLVLSKGCHFCSESAPFYQRLVRDLEGRDSVRLVAVLPQDVSEGRKYLDELGVSVNEIKQSNLESLGVSGTPTLIMVNNEGVVTDSWVGKLPSDKESEVLGRLQGNKVASR